jgi:PAS domain S-box-containing protein
LLFGLPSPALPAAEIEPPDVLILHSYHLGQPWTDGVMAGMQEEFARSGANLRLQVEYMDTKRFHDPAYLSQLLDVVLTYKLQRTHFNLLLLSDNDAFNFALRHRNDLFADTPIVFCGVNNFQPQMLAGIEDITGVAENPDFRTTLDLALRFHPAARRIVVIGNTRNETDRQNYRLLLEVIPEFAGRVQFEHWDDLPLEDLVERLDSLGPETIIFLNGLLTDAQGRTIPFAESTPVLHDATAAPLYSVWDFFLGNGIVGGRLVSSRRHGELAAQLALRVLNGEDPDTIPVVEEGANVYMFDDRELRRFAISHRSLPADSLVINTPKPFFTLSRSETYQGLALVAALVTVLTTLVGAIYRRRRAEAALRESEQRFRAIADYTYDWEIWMRPDGVLHWLSPSATRHTGYNPAESRQMPHYPLAIVHEDDREEMSQFFSAALCLRTSGNNYPFRIRRKSGEVRWMAASWQPIYDEKGGYLGSRASIRDITERQLAEEELKEANQELDAFVRSISHDLRTPLTPIIGYAELLRARYGDRLDATGRLAVDQIEQTGRRMLAMLEELLVMAQMGEAEYPEEPIDTAELVKEILEMLAPQLRETGATVEVSALPLLRVPRSLLSQALENLIGNAVRYADRNAPIEIGGDCRGVCACIHVRDHGPGIPEQEKERIFDPFYRGTTGQHLPGTGVGLATVRRIARRCGGRVWVEDTPGGGSTFFLELETAECRMEREGAG